MKKILLTSFIALGFGMVALAQQEPTVAKIDLRKVKYRKAQSLKGQQFKLDADRAAQESAKVKLVPHAQPAARKNKSN